jgi:transcription elongation GreA/GreB family factor
MSRAFVKDQDEAVDDLPERLISTAPNLVTPEGLGSIEAEVARLSDALANAGDDRAERARIARDLRYWTARRGSAHVIDKPADCTEVRFGCAVTFHRDDGRQQSFRIVGEDEADPQQGTISHVSPLARALIGKRVGDVARVGPSEIEIVAID